MRPHAATMPGRPLRRPPLPAVADAGAVTVADGLESIRLQQPDWVAAGLVAAIVSCR